MTHTCKHDAETLKQLQALPLRAKIFESRQRIAEWVKHWGEDKVYVAFSGGKDSTVLLDLVRRDYPDVPAVFCDTGLEYPEIRDFVKTFDNVTWIRPEMGFKDVIEKYGYPVISKRIAQYVHEVRSAKGETATKKLRLTGIKTDGSKSPMGKISDKWQKLCYAPFETSNHCCKIMKKDPSRKYGKETGRVPFVGAMASDGNQRELTYTIFGCNAFELASQPRSWPMAFWLESNVWEYIKLRNLAYSKIYDIGYDRTGCMFCAFGAHLNTPNRFQRMQHTHPKQWKYCMDKLGMRDVLEYCGIPVEDKQLELDFGDKA